MPSPFQFSLRSLFLVTTACALMLTVMIPFLQSQDRDRILLAALCVAAGGVSMGWYFFSFNQLRDYRWSSLGALEFVFYATGVLAGGVAGGLLLIIALLALLHLLG